jgi:hypothetical protein
MHEAGVVQLDKATPIWTNPDVPGKKLAAQPVYVLTSARTFSGAEAFAYDLQTTKRATIVCVDRDRSSRYGAPQYCPLFRRTRSSTRREPA